MSDSAIIQSLVSRWGITRLCHMTPTRNLLQIVQGGGVRSTTQLNGDERALFDQQDLARYDGYSTHICCSVEYPNYWYLRRRKGNATPEQRQFPDWACLLIDPKHLWRDDTLFCHRNAASSSGAYVSSGATGFKAMFAPEVMGARGVEKRYDKPLNCTTDDQAEVLINHSIPLTDVLGVALPDEAHAKRMHVRFSLAGADPDDFTFIIAKGLFDGTASASLRAGKPPHEYVWEHSHGA